MKTSKNSRTATTSGTQLKPEQTVPDTNTRNSPCKYNVQIFWRSTKILSHTITANSLTEAEAMALEIKREDLPNSELTGLDGEIYIDTVSPINGGQDND